MSVEYTLDALLEAAVEKKGSDLHLIVGQPPAVRVSGKLERLEREPIDAATMDRLVLPVLAESQRAAFTEGSASTAEAIVAEPGAPLLFSVFAFRSQGHVGATIRILSNVVPALETVAGSSQSLFERLAQELRGLVLFTGPSGSGKGTAAAALIEAINQTRAEHVYLLDAPPFYVFESKRAFVTQVYIGQDFDSFERAAQAILKGGDPDVVAFGDLPSVDAARQALLLAETGHLVLAVLTADAAAEVPRMLLSAFPDPQEEVRNLLARNLVAVINQRLLRRAARPGRVAAYEVLLGTPAVREILRNGADEGALTAAMESGKADGMCTLNAALDALVANGDVTAEMADGYRADRRLSARHPGVGA